MAKISPVESRMTTDSVGDSTWVELSPYNTLGIPARAQGLCHVTSLTQLSDAVRLANQQGTPFLVLGQGSNTVFVGDYAGTVILNRLSGMQITQETDDFIEIKVQAGEDWHRFVGHCVNHGWHGIENLALIPGTVGAAPIQNIGAYGVEVKDTIVGVDVFDTLSLEPQTLSNADCRFAYRESRFKQEWAGRKIVTAVTFKLNKASTLQLSYPALEKYVLTRAKNKPNIKDVYDAVVQLRSEKLPAPTSTPNAGSFFKNPVVSNDLYKALKAEHPNLVAFEQTKGMKLAAAWLIDNAGWKHKQVDGVSVHGTQALVVINPNKKDGYAVERFAKAVQADVQSRYGVALEIEPRLIFGTKRASGSVAGR